MIKRLGYKEFSLGAHLGNLAAGRINTCQLELTYGCNLRCGYCYVGGFNNRASIRSELGTAGVKRIIDKLKDAGVLWLCLTGGDPLTRGDFEEIYAYAHRQGFLITLFTNACGLDHRRIRLLERMPPFVVEITLNAVEKRLYERISGVPGSFDKAMRAIRALRRGGIPFKLKAMELKLNEGHLPQVREFARGYGLKLEVDRCLHASLRHELEPLSYGVPVQAKSPPAAGSRRTCLFDCNLAGGDGIHIDPWGRLALCALLREPKVSVLRADIREAVERLLRRYRRLKTFKTDSPCRTCALREECGWCPGKAFVETGSLEKPLSRCLRIERG